MAKRSTSRRSATKAAVVPRRRIRRAFLVYTAAKICRHLAAADDDLPIYQSLMSVGELWVQVKEELGFFGISIEEWARENLPISRQWMDKHEELFKRSDEFAGAMAWAHQLPWEPDRKASLKKAFEMMDAKRRFDALTKATAGAVDSNQNNSCVQYPTSEQKRTLNLNACEYMHGDALEVLRSLPSDSVDTGVTSPAYFGGLRDYGVVDQLGWESSLEAYIAKLVAIFRELRRVIKPNGTVWLVLGDCYHSPGGTWRTETHKRDRNALRGTKQKPTVPNGKTRPATGGTKPKNLLLVPAQVALALQKDGWVLRTDAIWDKATVRPESIKDRPTRSHETIYLFAKQARYFYDGKAIQEPRATPLTYGNPNRKPGVIRDEQIADFTRRWGNPSGRNARTVWRIRSKPYHGNHPATFPVELPERCLKATLPPGGVVIDVFGGAGTTAIAALRLGASKVILIDTNQRYLDEARERISKTDFPSHAMVADPIQLGQDVALHPGDCRDVLPKLPSDSIDVISFDAPYWLRTPVRDTLIDFHRRNNGMKPRIREAWDEFHSVDDYLETAETWILQLMRVLNTKGSLFIFANQHNLGLINYVLQRSNIQFVNQIIWRKPSGIPNLSGRRLQTRHEVIIWAIKGTGYRFNYKAVKAYEYPDKRADVQMNDVWLLPTVGRGESVGHPAQKPVALYERLLDMCGVRGGTLLDPMAGSGTAAIAAARWGMRAILIEREVSYVEMIQQRWTDFEAQPQPPANDDQSVIKPADEDPEVAE